MELIWKFEVLQSREPNVLLLNIEEGYLGSQKKIQKMDPPRKKNSPGGTCHSHRAHPPSDANRLALPVMATGATVSCQLVLVWSGYGVVMELIWTLEYLPNREPKVLSLIVEDGYFGSQKKIQNLNL
jgi:hypothetical protein